jgi:hypothetical protein
MGEKAPELKWVRLPWMGRAVKESAGGGDDPADVCQQKGQGLLLALFCDLFPAPK